MMKRLSMLFVVLVLLFVPDVVLGEDIENSHILTIENFKISGSNMTVGGYSFISHLDNYGILEGNSKGNLSTYLVAYKGEWKDSYATSNYCDNSNQQNCYRVKATLDNRNMWWARCTGAACTKEKEVINGVGNKYTADTCHNVENNYAWGSHCIYKNVGFSVNIDLFKVIKRFSGGQEEYSGSIKFKVVSSVKVSDGNVNFSKTVDKGYVGKDNSNYVWASNLSVYSGICKIGSGKRCVIGENQSGDFKFKLSGLANTVHYDALLSYPRFSDGSKEKNYYFLDGKNYNISQFNGIPVDITKTVGDVTGRFADSLVKLETEIDRNTKLGQSKLPAVVPMVNGKDEGYYAFSNYVTFNGNFELSYFGLSVKKLNCSDFGFGNDKKSNQTVNCGEKKGFNECMKAEKVQDTIYILADQHNCTNVGDVVKLKDNKYYYAITVSTDVIFNQSAQFKFGLLNPGVVYAGKGFSLNETTYSNEVTWGIGLISSSGDPYYRYLYEIPKVSGNSCVVDNEYDIKNKTYYYYNSNGDFDNTTDLKEASFDVIQKRVMGVESSSIVDDNKINNITFNSCDSNDSSGCIVNDSGKITSNGKLVDGNWNVIGSKVVADFKKNGEIFGKTITSNYKYSLADSYVSVAGDDAGKALYGEETEGIIEELVHTGNKFYVDFRWVYEGKWPFNLSKDINPSFVKGMDWNLNGVCSVKVEDSYYTDASGDSDNPGKLELNYKYRSISLSNPFPKANNDLSNIAVNWKEWYNKDINKNRLKNTYNYPLNYSIVISKTGYGNTAKVSEINKLNYGYLDTNSLLADGSSLFVTPGNDIFYASQFFERNVSKGINYCGLGYFSSSCDVWQ